VLAIFASSVTVVRSFERSDSFAGIAANAGKLGVFRVAAVRERAGYGFRPSILSCFSGSSR
jgi:hypothetical protein